MSDSFQSRIDAIINKAQQDVLAVTRDYVASQVTGSAAPAAAAAPPPARRATPARKATKPAAKRPAAKAKAKASRAAGVKRDPAVIEKIQADFLAYVTANPGQGIEEIKKAIKIDTKDLVLPVKKLLADKKISTKGEKRATKYFPKG